MKKLILTAVAAAALFSGAFAQTKSTSATSSGTKLSIGLDFGVPIGDWSEGYSIGFGGSGKAEIPVVQAFNFTLTAGYINYYFKKPYSDIAKAAGTDAFVGYVPLKAGGKYFFSSNFYGEAELGALIGTNHDSRTSFVYSPGLGVSFPVSDKHDIDFGARYESWSLEGGNTSQVAFRIAYKFGL